MGFGQLNDRPDMSGILVDFRVDLRDLSKPPAFYAIGVRAGDEEKKEALRAMAGMAFETGWSILLTDENLDVILEVSP
jgi:hypothetical protein